MNCSLSQPEGSGSRGMSYDHEALLSITGVRECEFDNRSILEIIERTIELDDRERMRLLRDTLYIHDGALSEFQERFRGLSSEDKRHFRDVMLKLAGNSNGSYGYFFTSKPALKAQ